jgi:hypothetical protein
LGKFLKKYNCSTPINWYSFQDASHRLSYLLESSFGIHCNDHSTADGDLGIEDLQLTKALDKIKERRRKEAKNVSIKLKFRFSKGQLISKCLFGVFSSSKKRTETIRPEVS